jgi:hypothetical protein
MILIPIKCVAAKKNVTIKLLVKVNVYGIKPNKFEKKIKINRNIKTEKYSFRFNAVLDFNIDFVKK